MPGAVVPQAVLTSATAPKRRTIDAARRDGLVEDGHLRRAGRVDLGLGVEVRVPRLRRLVGLDLDGVGRPARLVVGLGAAGGEEQNEGDQGEEAHRRGEPEGAGSTPPRAV